MAAHPSGWQVTGTAPVAWERFMIPSLVERQSAYLVERAGPRPGDRVLDVACGTGLAARTALARVRWGGTVTGLDINAGQLEVARQAAHFCDPPIDFREGDAQAMPFDDGSFDIVLCQHGLAYIPDRSASLHEMWRVLVPGGRLALMIWRHGDHHPAWTQLADAYDRHVGPGCGDPMRSIFQLHDGEHIRRLVRQAGFSDVTLEIRIDAARFPSLRDFVGFQSSVLPRPNPAHDPMTAIEPITAELARTLAHCEDDLGFTFPCQTWVVTATR